MNVPTFSVIIPVHNMERHLRDCLDAICGQTCRDFEAILVDDGSTDGSAAICREYAERDARFRYHYKENGGVSAARNAGIEMARGEWLLFADSDDLLLPDSLAVFARLCAADGVTLCMGTYIMDSFVPKDCFAERRTFELALDRHSMMELMFRTDRYGYQGYIWNKVFRRDIVQSGHLHFDTSVYFNEDRLFCVEYICRMTGKAIFSSLPVYRYIKRESGTVGAAYVSFNPRLLTDYESSVTILRLLERNGFPMSVIRLGKDRLIDSYDLIRHNMRAVRYERYEQEKAALCKRTKATVGRWFYACYRVRLFLSRQYYNVFRRRIYIR